VIDALKRHSQTVVMADREHATPLRIFLQLDGADSPFGSVVAPHRHSRPESADVDQRARRSGRHREEQAGAVVELLAAQRSPLGRQVTRDMTAFVV
jgi:hypothetical protein